MRGEYGSMCYHPFHKAGLGHLHEVKAVGRNFLTPGSDVVTEHKAPDNRA